MSKYDLELLRAKMKEASQIVACEVQTHHADTTIPTYKDKVLTLVDRHFFTDDGEWINSGSRQRFIQQLDEKIGELVNDDPEGLRTSALLVTPHGQLTLITNLYILRCEVAKQCMIAKFSLKQAEGIDTVYVCPDSLFHRLDKNPDINDFEVQHGLPPLTGSPKQVEWARTIRWKQMREIWEHCETADTDQDLASFIWLKEQMECAFWIDARGFDPLFGTLQLRAAWIRQQEKAAEELLARKTRAEKARKHQKPHLDVDGMEEFEAEHDLPPLRGDSNKQLILGRASRFNVLRNATDLSILSANSARSSWFWISEWNRVAPGVSN